MRLITVSRVFWHQRRRSLSLVFCSHSRLIALTLGSKPLSLNLSPPLCRSTCTLPARLLCNPLFDVCWFSNDGQTIIVFFPGNALSPESWVMLLIWHRSKNLCNFDGIDQSRRSVDHTFNTHFTSMVWTWNPLLAYHAVFMTSPISSLQISSC